MSFSWLEIAGFGAALFILIVFCWWAFSDSREK